MYFLIKDNIPYPASTDATYFVRKYTGQTVKLEYKPERDAKSNALFWVRATKIAELLSDDEKRWGTYELVKITEKKLGYVKILKDFDGTEYIVPLSLSFPIMSQKTFDKFIDEAYNVWAVMMGTTTGEMLANL